MTGKNQKQDIQNRASNLGISETVQSLLDLDQVQAALNLVEAQEQNQKLQAENQKLKSSSSNLTQMQKLYQTYKAGEQQKNFDLVYDTIVNYYDSNKDILARNNSSQSNVPTGIKKALLIMYEYNMLNTGSEVYTQLANEIQSIDNNTANQSEHTDKAVNS